MRTLIALSLALLLLFPSNPAQAEVPPKPDDWIPVTPVHNCLVDTASDAEGQCRIFMDSTGRMWKVFWNSLGEISFIRSFPTAPYEYIYEHTVEPIGIDV